MATTTNYSWTTPDDTALVKDGAAAIRTLGSSVDTTVKNLNPETTLGDISYRSSTANVNTRLALGTAGQLLQVNSGATAPEWATISTGGMTLISTTTLTGASVTLTSIPQTYTDLVLYIQNYRPATDGTNLRLRPNGTATATQNTIYTNANTNQSTATDFSTGEIEFAFNTDNGTSSSLHVVEVPNYTNSTTWKLFRFYGGSVNSTTTTNWNPSNGFGAINTTTAITSIQLANGSGNFTSGTVLLYGVK